MAITTKNFKTKLSGFVKSSLSQRDNLQELVLFAVDHAKVNNDEFTLLTNIMEATLEIKSIRTTVLKDYIKAHVTNLEFGKNKAGAYMFKKSKKGVDCVYTEMTTPWYDHASPANKATEIDVIKRTESTINSMVKALEKGTVKAGHQQHAKNLIAALGEFLKNTAV